MRSGVPLHPEDTVLQHLTDMVRAGGVLDPATDMLVTEPAGGGLNVDVGTGRGYIKKSGNAYPVRITSTESNITITSNSSGNPRIDAIVLYVDLSATPDGVSSQGEDVLELVAVAGTPASSPTAPNSSQIESIIGSSNPYLVLANVTVASGATGISTANITQVAPRLFMKTPKPIYEITYGATVTPDYENGDEQFVTLTGDITFNAPSNMVVGDWLMLKVVQDSTGGRAVTWFSGITWLSADTSLNDSASKVTVYAIKKVGTSSYEGYLVGKEY